MSEKVSGRTDLSAEEREKFLSDMRAGRTLTPSKLLKLVRDGAKRYPLSYDDGVRKHLIDRKLSTAHLEHLLHGGQIHGVPRLNKYQEYEVCIKGDMALRRVCIEITIVESGRIFIDAIRTEA